MRKIAVTLAAAVLLAPMSFGFGEAKAMIGITVKGAVWHGGVQRVPVDTPLEDVLNGAICHQGSLVRKIRVVRKAGDQSEEFVVRPHDEQKKEEQPQFKLRDGDIVIVPETLFDENDRKVRRVVKGPFVLRWPTPIKK